MWKSESIDIVINLILLLNCSGLFSRSLVLKLRINVIRLIFREM